MSDNLVRRVTWRTADIARVLTLALVFLFLWRFFWMVYTAIFVTLLAILLAIVLHAPAKYLARWIPFAVAFGLSTAFFLASVTALIISIVPQVAQQVSTLAAELPNAIHAASDWIGERTDMARDPQVLESINRQWGEFLGRFVPLAFNAITTAIGSITILIMAIFLGYKPSLYRDMLVGMASPPARSKVERVYDETGRSLKVWVLGKAITMLLVGVATWIGLTLFGIPGALALAALAGLLEFVPTLGPLIAAAPAIMAAFLISPATALWVALFYLVLQQIQSGVTLPLVDRRAVDIPPAALLAWQIMLAVGFGLMGLFVATPLLAIVVVAARILYVEPTESFHAMERREVVIPSPQLPLEFTAQTTMRASSPDEAGSDSPDP
jgi:predicted PurR-regulated permease PerM